MKIRKRSILITMLICVIILGHLVSILPRTLMGVAPTLQRLLIPVFTIILFFWRMGSPSKFYSNSFNYFLCVIVVWIIWGILGLFISPYSGLKDGAKEILCIMLGFGNVLCIYECVRSKKDIDTIFAILRWIVIGLLFMACLEAITDWHLASSSLREISMKRISVAGISLYCSTTIFYNVNDFCAFLAILLPLFFKEKKGYKIIDIMVLFCGIFLMWLDDANICIFAIFFSFIVYNMVVVGHFEKKFLAIILVVSFLILINKVLSSQLSIFSLEETVTMQITNAKMGMGSLYSRLMVYMESVKATIKTYGLGLGPAGFIPYFQNTPHKGGLVNPHNYWLEILSQYGILIFVLYVWLCVREFKNMLEIYKRNRGKEAAIMIAVYSSFVFASIAPSSFLEYSYQWVVLSLCITIEKIYQGQILD